MSSKDMIEGLKTNENWAFETLYKEYFDTVKRYVLKNNGTMEDAKDVFQETAIALVRMLAKQNFKLNENTKLSTLVYSIASKQWLMVLRKNKLKVSTTEISDMNCDFKFDDESFLETQIYTERQHLVAECLKTMKEECNKLLSLYYFKNLKLKDIATIMSYTDSFVRVKKNRCMNTLRDKVNSLAK